MDRRLVIEQPRHGYRAGSDTVLLASAVPAEAGQSVMEFGCGVATASLCLGFRVKQLDITGIEIQPEMVMLAQRNIARNTLGSTVTVLQGDVTGWQLEWAGRFDHVMMNPPYHEAASHTASPRQDKRIAHHESDGDLGLWIDHAIDVLKPGGMITLIHRADRKDDIVKLVEHGCGMIETIYFLPKTGIAPKRLIMRAIKGGTASLSVREVILHHDNGHYLPQIDGILRHGQSLDQALR